MVILYNDSPHDYDLTIVYLDNVSTRDCDLTIVYMVFLYSFPQWTII